ncbi:uncharacterized protein UV8b_04479 [Ustilaginoidea virens]|nr:uncharacterized protein UV8b_04479 [Ustilaginoidea virens]QUC20238.1 hypothetical protein UV8b_04479 [Ustilaginoidea virens]
MDAGVDDDPITASYSVFLNPALPLGRRLLVLQQPNRTDDAPRPPPTELRLKPQSGMVEVDLPLDNTRAYDRDKGLRWGRVLQSSLAAKSGGTHGLAGGFGFGAVPQRGRRKGEPDDDAAAYMDWNEAVRQDKVLKTQTLGGQYPDSDEVQYMVGVFQGNNLHLTPVSSLVHLRPQLHHLDAATQQERAASAAAAAASKDAAAASSAPTAARAIHMTIKNTADGEAITTETMADRLRFVQTEDWRKMRYTDENDEAAWDVYNESLFLRAPADAGAGAGADDKENPGDLEGSVPRFGAKWGRKRLLEAISGIVNDEAEPEPEPEAQHIKPEARPDGGAAVVAGKAKARPRNAPSRPISLD